MKNLIQIILASLSVVLVLACEKSKTTNPMLQKETVKGDVVEDRAPADGNWFIKDSTLDKLEGVGSERAQKEFSLKNQREIVVAVIDSGVDISHEDIKNKIWNNPGEMGLDSLGIDKKSNGIDDDLNGYVDDIHGWNFIGAKDGRPISFETLEITRESLRYDKKIANGEVLGEEEKIYFEKINEEYKKQYKNSENSQKLLSDFDVKITVAKKILKEKLNFDDNAPEKIDAIVSNDAEVLQAKSDLQEIAKNFRSIARFYRIYENTKNSLAYFLNKNFNAREIVGDDPSDFTQSQYGNNDVMGPDASHGTHVSGIIAAESSNGLGIDGVAQNVKIMVLRVVPNGDERDKDIFMAVNYAVKNGAQIINMSFGKEFSPSKEKLDEAFSAAAEKGVLLFHSAGNGASNNDVTVGYPNRHVLNSVVKKLPEQISTWLEIGASAQYRGLKMVAPFSDYGKKDVDFFSPGYEMKSSVPGNQYAVFSGTSMASPAAAGVGALLMSNFDSMTAQQAKAILIHESRLYVDLMVHLPGNQALDLPVPFAQLSATGGVIDAYKSIKFARELTNEVK